MNDFDDSMCWMHLVCEQCGGIHDSDEPCQTSDRAIVPEVHAPTRGSRGLAFGQLNATMVVLAPDAALPPASVDRDVALTVVAGSGVLSVGLQDDEDAPATQVELRPGSIAILPTGCRRIITAGDDGLTWSSVHRRRE